MRELVIAKLTTFIATSDGYGIPREFDCSDEDAIKDPAELETMSDEQLLQAFEAVVGFWG
jgi:hypothetical protein